MFPLKPKIAIPIYIFSKKTDFLCILISQLPTKSIFRDILISRLSSKCFFRGNLILRFFILDRETAKFSCHKVFNFFVDLS